MQWQNEILLGGALLLAFAVALGGLSSRMGLPFLLVFLLVGMLAGEDGPGGIAFGDFALSFVVGNLALAVILLDGGLRTRLPTFRVGLRPALVLASAGVAITAASTGLFAAWVLDIDWRLGLLLGAIVGSTDAAAVFSLLKASGLRLNDRIAATLEIESGINDPMAIFLTLGLIGVVQAGAWPGAAALALDFLRQFGVGAVAGIAAGWLMAETARWWSVAGGLAAILLAAAGVAVFALTNLLGGSGFLAVYLFGLVAAHRWRGGGQSEILRAMDGLAWLAQAGMFLLLGLLVTPSELPGLMGAALAISAFLIFVARPAAVVACLAPFRFSARETGYVAWVGLRGAVPIVLALFPLLAGVTDSKLLFNVAFVVVLVSLLVQGTTVAFAARRFGVELPRRIRPLAEHQLAGGVMIVEFRVGAGAPVCHRTVDSVEWPEGCRVAHVWSAAAPASSATASAALSAPLRAGDVVGLIGDQDLLARCSSLFAPAAPRQPSPLSWQLPADARWGEILAAYGLANERALPEGLGLGEALETLAGRALVEGDRVRVGGTAFVVVAVHPGSGRAARFAFEPRVRAAAR